VNVQAVPEVIDLRYRPPRLSPGAVTTDLVSQTHMHIRNSEMRPQMNKYLRISATDRLSINSIAYTHYETNNDQHLLQRVDQPDLIEGFSHAELDRLWDSNDLRFEQDYFTPTMTALRLKNGTLSINDLSDNERAIILHRQAYCDRYLTMVANGEAVRTNEGATEAAIQLEPIVNRLGLGTAKKRKARAGTKVKDTDAGEFRAHPIGRTLLQWVRAYEKGGCNPMALRRTTRFCGNYGSKLETEVEAIVTVEVAKYASDTKPTKEAIMLAIEGAIRKRNAERTARGLPKLEKPNKKTVIAAIDRLDPFYVMTKRYGRDYAEKHSAWVGQGLVMDKPGHRIQIDEHEIDVVTLAIRSGIWEILSPEERKSIKRVRRWISVAIDCATRVVLGMRILATPTKEGALATLKMVTMDKGAFISGTGALSPWDHKCGLSVVVCDWGAAYASAEVRAAVANAGATQEYPPAGQASLRGMVERMFGTVGTQLAGRLHGKTWSDIASRGDYPSAKKAGLTDDEFAFVLIRYVVDIYHNMPHSGLMGETPNGAWKRLTALHGVKPTPDAHARRSIFGLMVERTITNRGIRILGNYYRDSENNQLGNRFLHGRDLDVDVMVDPDNLGAISVKLDGIAIQVKCENEDMEGRTVANWIATMTALRTKFRAADQMTRHIIFATLDDIERINDGARRRATISAPMTTDKDVDHAEASIFARFEMPREQVGEASELLGEVISPLELAAASREVAETQEPWNTAMPKPVTIHDQDTWSMKD
jgi:putative transposase